jgi:DNA-binding NarL/FixJ family response regulator
VDTNVALAECVETIASLARSAGLDEHVDGLHGVARALRAAGPARRPTLMDGLSARERQVALLVSVGLRDRQIAERLVVSERTVHCHVRHILNKLGLTGRGQVAAWAGRLYGPESPG